MNKNIAIKAVDISKQYRLGEVGTGTISHDLNRFWAKMRGKEDPFLKIGESNDRSVKGSSDYVWSLKDINFEIEKGDAVGIIGRNGAGKSTLLKLLSQVTSPTTGYFDVQGRIASLLEVGTGFNPEMTGRENIFLNGAILGMRKHEIRRKFDEIVDFAGVERYIDTPVKRYSSGMYVRLAFAVAAHLESEILIVDEVLAVGDAEFQKKCLGKMGDVSKGEGRTVLFVSHNMGAVKNLCDKGIYLKNGKKIAYDLINPIVQKYLDDGQDIDHKYVALSQNSTISFRSIVVTNSFHEEKSVFEIEDDILISFNINIAEKVSRTSIFVSIVSDSMVNVFSTEIAVDFSKDEYILKISARFLSRGRYNVTTFIHIPGETRLDEVINVCTFEILDHSSIFVKYPSYEHGLVFGNYEWL